MNTKKIAVVAAIAALAGAVVTASNAAATAAPTTQTRTEKTHLMVWSVNSDGPFFRTLLTGAVGDYGSAVTVLPDGTVDPDHTSELELNLVNGSFRLSFIPIAKALAQAVQHVSPNPATCSVHVRITAPAPVVAGTGTGIYRGIAGGFSVTVTMDEVLAKPACTLTSSTLSELIVLDGTGHISY